MCDAVAFVLGSWPFRKEQRGEPIEAWCRREGTALKKSEFRIEKFSRAEKSGAYTRTPLR